MDGMEEIVGFFVQKIVILQDVRGIWVFVQIVKLVIMVIDVCVLGYVVLVVVMKMVDVWNVRMVCMEICVNRYVLKIVENLFVFGMVIVGFVNLVGMDRIVNVMDIVIIIFVMNWVYVVVVWMVGMGFFVIRYVQNIVEMVVSEILESVFSVK